MTNKNKPIKKPYPAWQDKASLVYGLVNLIHPMHHIFSFSFADVA